MLGRSFEVKVVKTPKTSKPPKTDGSPDELSEEEQEFENKLEAVQDFVRSLVLDGAKLFAAYMVLDTWRKVTIVKAARVCTKC